MDVELFAEIGKEFKRRFAGCEINKILTIEASGIGIACVVAQYFHCPVIFAKEKPDQEHRRRGLHRQGGVLHPWPGLRYHRGQGVSWAPGDRVLLIDDFLANGAALEGLAQLVKDAGAELVGAGIVIEEGLPARRRPPAGEGAAHRGSGPRPVHE